MQVSVPTVLTLSATVVIVATGVLIITCFIPTKLRIAAMMVSNVTSFSHILRCALYTKSNTGISSPILELFKVNPNFVLRAARNSCEPLVLYIFRYSL